MIRKSLFNSIKKHKQLATICAVRTLPKPTTVIDIGKVKEDFTKGGRKIMIGINFVKNDFTGKEA